MIFLLMAAAAVAPDCDNAITQWEMNNCAAKQFGIADAEMNKQWAVTTAQLKAQDKELAKDPDQRPGYFETLLKAQRAWLTFREAHCASEGYNERDGSMEPLLIIMCRTDLTKERTEQLRALIQVQ